MEKYENISIIYQTASLVSIIVSGTNGRSMEVAYTFWGRNSESLFGPQQIPSKLKKTSKTWT